MISLKSTCPALNLCVPFKAKDTKTIKVKCIHFEKVDCDIIMSPSVYHLLETVVVVEFDVRFGGSLLLVALHKLITNST